MSISTLLPIETHLVGRIVTSSVETTSTTIYAQFEDKKTGVARTPQSTTKLFMLSKDSDRAELIFADSHTTSGGITTITVNAAGRGLNKYGGLSGSGTGYRHPINSEIGCATSHLPIQEVIDILNGTSGSGFNIFRIGDETDSDIYYYAQNADTNKPYIKYDKTTSKWVFSNDGSSETDVGGGTGSISAGDGIDIAAGVVSLDIKANSGLQITATELDLDIRSNFGLVADSNGLYIDLDTDPGLEFNSGKLRVKVKTGGGVTRDSDGLSVADTTTTVVAGESIDGSSTAQALAMGGTAFKRYEVVSNDYTGFIWTAPDGVQNMGEVDANTRVARKWTSPNITTGTISIDAITLQIDKVAAPTDNLTVEIYTNDGGVPSTTLVTNATSDVVDGSTLQAAVRQPVRFVFSTPPELTANTIYWIVFRRSTANDAVNYYEWAYKGTAAGEGATYTASTLTWVNITSKLAAYVEYSVDYGGKAFKGDANDFHRCDYIGFTTSNVAADANLQVQALDTVTIAGLTRGENYVLNTTAGGIVEAIGFTPATNSTALIPTGKALTTTQFDIHTQKTKRAYGNFGNIRMITNNLTTKADFRLPVECGFTPERVDVWIHYELGANSDTTHHLIALFAKEVIANNFTGQTGFALNDAGGPASYTDDDDPAQVGEGANNGIVIQETLQNGFVIRFYQKDLAKYPTYIYWLATA